MRYIRCFKTLYIFLYEWIIFPDKMTFFRLSHEVNSKHMFVMIRVRHVETQISLSETNEGVKTKNKAKYVGVKISRTNRIFDFGEEFEDI